MIGYYLHSVTSLNNYFYIEDESSGVNIASHDSHSYNYCPHEARITSIQDLDNPSRGMLNIMM